MNDMSVAIIPKSDQLNADDLIAGPRTITITRVAIHPSAEQKVEIFFDGDNGKPFRPCKSMCRVMVAVWGPDANAYVGRSLTIFRDPTVKWGGMAVGGIRISHMSHTDREHVLALTETKGKRAPFKVRVLEAAAKSAAPASGRPYSTVAEARAWCQSSGTKWAPAVFLDAVECEFSVAADRAAVDALVEREDVQAAVTGGLKNGALEHLNKIIAAAIARVSDDALTGEEAA